MSYNETVKTNYNDRMVAPCPVTSCGMAIRPHGIGIASHLDKHVRNGEINVEERRVMLRKLRGTPEGVA